ncbi:unnamed protein product [Brachionus calyciflorus]|uniref:Ceramide transfer protein n=1 Tax=Brachionus calyciflorus TaxID=104777 RepID=A0A814CPV8_9BILA|nr:unnamed protein product [Brachionus calyciflorus]
MSNNDGVNVNVSDEDDTHSSTNEDETNQNQVNQRCSDLASNLFKWTNYIHGWQERYIVLKDGVLSYYKSQDETQYGCRGAIALKQSNILPHDLDDCRFDIRVNDCCWYLRANTVEERQKWLEILEEHRSESGYGSQTSLRRHGSLMSLNSTHSLSVQSTGSYKRAHGLKEKLEEMETFKDILCRQVETLQTYFDACANSLTHGFEPYHKEMEKKLAELSDDEGESVPSDLKPKELNRARIEDHAAMAIDFKGEAYTFKATTVGILHNLSHCIELMQQREEFLKKKLDREVEKRKKIEEQMKEVSKGRKQQIIIAGPDFEEGPHSNIKEEQFFDAVDSTLDTLEEEEERRVAAFESLTKIPELKPVPRHRLSDEIEKIVQEHLKFDLVDDFNSNIWELLAADGEMKVYRRELEENGIVLDPLKAVHSVKGVTGHEVCKYFWDPAVRMEWEGTLDSSRMLEALSDDTLIFNQVHKRVWPAAQRDTCFWSHIRSVSKENKNDLDDWIVVNYSTTHDSAPIKEPMIRAWANVALICSTIILNRDKYADLSSVPRENLVCKITYVAQVNPGGWAPANVLRAVYKREYPKFLKRFTQYVMDKTKKLPILL